MNARDDLPNEAIIFPTSLPQWPQIKEALQHLRHQHSTINTILTQLQHIYKLIHGSPTDQQIDRQAHSRVSEQAVFSGLKYWLLHVYSPAETQTFCSVILPCIVERALEIEHLVSAEGVRICSSQQNWRVETRRLLAASILASSFLCLLPLQPRNNASRNNLNFDTFFSQLQKPDQSSKMGCILHYFERLSSDPGGPVGSLIISVQVTTNNEMPSLGDWKSCNMTLCPLEVKTRGTVCDAGPQALQVTSREGLASGPVLCANQTERHLCCCPELIAALMFVDSPQDTEAIMVQGYETYVCCDLDHDPCLTEPFYDKAKRNRYGNLETVFCAIEAPHCSDVHKCYRDNSILHEITRIFAGLQQRELQPLFSAGVMEEEESGQVNAEGAVGGCCRGDDAASVAAPIATPERPPVPFPKPLAKPTSDRAKQAVVSSHPHSPSSSNQLPHSPSSPRKTNQSPSSPLQINKSPPNPRQLPLTQSTSSPRKINHSPSSPHQLSPQSVRDSPDGVLPSSRHRHFMPEKQASVTLPAVTVPRQYSLTKQASYGEDWEDRRRSSNLSDITSRRSSSTSSSSRRSSGKRSSSEFSSEFEEYYDTFQRQERKLKPLAIEEEEGLSCLATLPEGSEIHSTIGEAAVVGTSQSPVDPIRPTASRPPLYMMKKHRKNVVSEDSELASPCGGSLDASASQDSFDLATSADAPSPTQNPLQVSQGGARTRTTQHSRRPASSSSQHIHRHQPGIVHFVDNLVNHASEESRQQLRPQTSSPQPPSNTMSLDLVGGFSTEVAPVAPIDSEKQMTKVPTRRIELKEESPPAKNEAREMANASRSILVTESRSSMSSQSPSGSPSASVSFSPQLLVHPIPEEHVYNGEGGGHRDHLQVVMPIQCAATSPKTPAAESHIQDEASKDDDEFILLTHEEEIFPDKDSEISMVLSDDTHRFEGNHEKIAGGKGNGSSPMGDTTGVLSKGFPEESSAGVNIPLNQSTDDVTELVDGSGRSESVNLPVHQYAVELTRQVYFDAMAVLGVDCGETDDTEQRDQASQGADLFQRKILYYVDCIVCGVLRRGMRIAAQEMERMKQTPSTMCSSEEDLIATCELHSYAQNFVEDVLEDSLGFYQRQYMPTMTNRKHKSVEELWVKPSDTVEDISDDSKYFAAEFSADDGKPIQNACPSDATWQGSFENFLTVRRRSSGFKSSLLSDFEHELMRSNVSTPSLLEFEIESKADSKRRASEPATGVSLDFLALGSQHVRSSPDITGSSRELILDWLEECSASASGNRATSRRHRTTSSHLEWFTQDILVDIFNDAFLELFGENYVAYWELSQASRREQQNRSPCQVVVDPSEILSDEVLNYCDNLTSKIMKGAYSGARKRFRERKRKNDRKLLPEDEAQGSQLEMVADSFAWQVITDAQMLLKREITLDSQCARGDRVVAMDSLGVIVGDSQLRCLLQWAAASRAGAPSLLYFSLSDPDIASLESLARTLRHQLFTVGELMTVILKYCESQRDGGQEGVTLFNFLRESSI